MFPWMTQGKLFAIVSIALIGLMIWLRAPGWSYPAMIFICAWVDYVDGRNQIRGEAQYALLQKIIEHQVAKDGKIA